MHKITRRVLGAAALALLAAGSTSFAQQPQTVRVRGTVEAVDGADAHGQGPRRTDHL